MVLNMPDPNEGTVEKKEFDEDERLPTRESLAKFTALVDELEMELSSTAEDKCLT